LEFNLRPPSTRLSSPGAITSSPSSFATEAWSKPSPHEKIKNDIGITYDILDNINASTSKLIPRKTIDSAADDFIDPV
jgi:hypothetical protein